MTSTEYNIAIKNLKESLDRSNQNYSNIKVIENYVQKLKEANIELSSRIHYYQMKNLELEDDLK